MGTERGLWLVLQGIEWGEKYFHLCAPSTGHSSVVYPRSIASMLTIPSWCFFSTSSSHRPNSQRGSCIFSKKLWAYPWVYSSVHLVITSLKSSEKVFFTSVMSCLMWLTQCSSLSVTSASCRGLWFAYSHNHNNNYHTLLATCFAAYEEFDLP